MMRVITSGRLNARPKTIGDTVPAVSGRALHRSLRDGAHLARPRPRCQHFHIRPHGATYRRDHHVPLVFSVDGETAAHERAGTWRPS